MFNLSQKHAIDRPILKCDSFKYTPPPLNLVSGENDFFKTYPEKIVLFH